MDCALDTMYADELELLAQLDADDGLVEGKGEPQPCCSKDIQKIKRVLNYDESKKSSDASMVKSSKPVNKNKPLQSKDVNALGFTESLMMTMNINNKKSGLNGKTINSSLKNDDSLRQHCNMMSNKSFYKKQSARQKRSPESDDEEAHYKRQKLDENKIHHRVPTSGDFISVTDLYGNKIYLSIKQPHQDQALKIGEPQSKNNLLGVSISELKLKIQVENQKKNQRDFETSSIDLAHNMASSQLWVDKYAAKSYFELISAESMNKALLRWLKMWDCCSFGKPYKSQKTEDFFGKQKKPIGNKNGYNGFNKNFNNYKDPNSAGLMVDEADVHKRPICKVALVSGPPGLGKTTLAHVVAKQAGYNAVEINASDDRSTELFREKLEASTQMKSVLAACDDRPNCLIIDEIDGAPQATIDLLVNLLKKPNGETNKKKSLKLLRPIICICNDLYVPALRSLRPLACLLPFQTPLVSALTNRLLRISQLEHLHTDTAALMALCEKTQNDMRSCINTLQFVKSKMGDNLTYSKVASMTIKDQHNSLMELLKQIFTIPSNNKKKHSNPHNKTAYQDEMLHNHSKYNADQQRFQDMLSLMSMCGDESKVQQSLFENYLCSVVKDPRMNLMLQASEWLCFSDRLDNFISSNQNYSFMKYLPFTAVSMHFLLSTLRPHKLLWPKSLVEHAQAIKRSKELLESILSGCHLSVKRYNNTSSYLMQSLPNLLHIIAPHIRPVNYQLLSKHEKENVDLLVKLMISNNLSYKQERNQDGSFGYHLQPNAEELVWWMERCKNHKRLCYSTKQFIAREIELEIMRKSSIGTVSKAETINKKTFALKPKPLSAKLINRVEVDFFGRKIEKPVTHATMGGSSFTNAAEKTFGVVWYQYKEGFTNAVKRNVQVKQFL